MHIPLVRGRWARTLALAGLLALLAACGGSSDNAPAADAPRPAGQALAGTGSTTVFGEDGVRVTVPEGALDEPVAITVSKDASLAPDLPDGVAVAGHIFAMQPHGQTFARPVQVRLPVAGGAAPAGSRLALAKADPGGAWHLIENVTVEGGQLVAEVDSFSLFLPVFVPSVTPVTTAGGLGALPEYRLTPIDPALASDPMAGSGGRVYRQTSPARVPFRIDVNIPAQSAFTAACPSSLATLKVYTGPATRYRLPSDAAGTVRLGGYTPDRVPVATLSLQVGAPQVLNFDVSAVDRMFDAGGALPPGAIRIEDLNNPADITGVSVDVDCGTMVLPNVVARFAVATDFSATTPRALALDLADATPAALDSHTFRAVVWRSQTSTARWLAQSPSGLNIWSDSTEFFLGELFGTPSLPTRKGAFTSFTLRIAVVQAAVEGYRFRMRETSGTTVELFTSRLALLTLPEGIPAPRITVEPQDATVRPGDPHRVYSQFVSTPLPRGATWQMRPNADAPWESLSIPQVSRSGYQNTRNPFVQPITPTEGSILLQRVSDAPVTMADNGRQFRAVFVNGGGTAASRVATLTVTTGLQPPALTLQPADLVAASGSAVQLTAAASGGAPLSYQWYANGRAVLGGNRPTLQFAAVNPGNAGDYQLEVLNPEGRLLSRVARLTVTGAGTAPSNLAITTQPASLTVAQGSSAGLAVGVSGASAPSFQWRRNGVDIAGATSAAYTMASIGSGDAGAYSVVVSDGTRQIASAVAQLNLAAAAPPTAPGIATPPAALAVNVGQTATLAVAAQGSGPLAYQWARDGVDIAGATSPVLTLSSAQLTDAGSYTVTVRNAAGSVTSAAAVLVVTPTPGAPAIVAQPSPLQVLVGATARFTATVSGNPAPQCLWTRNGIAIFGATDCTGFNTDAASLADQGTVYNVLAYSAGGVAFGQGAVLTVTTAVAPTITTQPSSQTAPPGGGTGFTVTADGTPAPTIEWGVNGGLIGASGRYVLAGCAFDHETLGGTLTLRNVTADCQGSIFVALARNVAGTALSDGATLNVRPAAVTATLVAGSPGLIGSDDGVGSAARFNTANYLTVASDGGIAVGDFNNSTVRIVVPPGAVSTLAGTPGVLGHLDGIGAAARFRGAAGVAYAANGDLFVADWDNHVIRRITPAGVVSTFAGSPGQPGTSNGTGTAARLSNPNGLAIAPDGTIYVADWGNHTVRRITPAGVVSTFAGLAGQRGSADGNGSAARFNTPSGVAVDGSGNVFVADQLNHAIRRIDPNGNVSTVAGLSGQAGTVDGIGSAARFTQPAWIAAAPDGTVFVVSAAGDTVRRVGTDGRVETVVGVLGESTLLRLGENPRLRNARGLWAAADGRQLLVAADHAIVRIDLP